VLGSNCLSQITAGVLDSRKIDETHSTITVHVYKSGFLSAFGHNHEIQAPIQSGEVKESGIPSVELRVDARKLQALDPEVAERSGPLDRTRELGIVRHGSPLCCRGDSQGRAIPRISESKTDGITPVTVAGGTVKVKDEVKIEFEIALLK
jgi:hypothetical protein